MKTEQLIRLMAADADAQRTRGVEAQLPWALAVGAAVAALAYVAAIDVRPDLVAALTETQVLFKQLLPWLVAAAGFGLVVRLSRPGGRPGGWAWLLAAAVVVLGAVMAVEAARLDPSAWGPAIRGRSIAACLVSIPLMSVPIATAVLWVLRSGASTRPTLTGAAAGLMSAGVAAGLYAFHCNEDSPLFYGIWYGLAVLVVAAVSAFVGRRLLRW